MPNWLSLIYTVTLGLIAATNAFVLMRIRTERNTEDIATLIKKHEESQNNFYQLTVRFQVFIENQVVTYKFVVDTLKALTDKVEKLDNTVIQNREDIAVLNAWKENNQ